MKIIGSPPEIEYDSLEEVKAAIEAHPRQQGYVVIVKRTKMVGNKKDGAV